jgi:hypothetical protein
MTLRDRFSNMRVSNAVAGSRYPLKMRTPGFVPSRRILLVQH